MNIILVQLSLLWKLIYDNLFRSLHKTLLRIITGNCEILRALYANDIKKFENSILNSYKLVKSQEILMRKSLTNEQIKEINDEIVKVKGIKDNSRNNNCLLNGLISLQNLYSSIHILENIRRTQVSLVTHSDKLRQLFRNLKGEDKLPSNLLSQRWIEIGFQGENPTTDFRAGGLLALENLLYFSANHQYQAQFCLKNSNEGESKYFFAVCGIYITKFLSDCLVMNFLDSYFYNCDYDNQARVMQHYNELYVKFFNYFDDAWKSSKRNIMQFNGFFETTTEDLLLEDRKKLIKILGTNN